MRKFLTFGFAAICTVCMLASCSDDKYTRFYDEEIEENAPMLSIERFDHDFYQLDSAQLVQKYGDFISLYVHQIMSIDSSKIDVFRADSAFNALRAQVDSVYPNADAVVKPLSVAMAYYHHYFPSKEIPKLSFHVSGFNQNIVTLPGRISASIDNYLGANYSLYTQIAYQYDIPYMTPRHLPIDMLLGWLTSEFPDSSTNLLESMIYHGKIMYLLQVFFPHEEVYELLSYSQKQYDWCLMYEKNIWAMITEKQELYSSDWRTITRYTQPAPFTNGLSQEDSPGRIGVFIGWRIVSAYLEKNEDITLQGLMSETDAQKILQLSGYRP